MYEENETSTTLRDEDFDEELALEFDSTHDPEAVWEWNGESWIAVAA